MDQFRTVTFFLLRVVSGFLFLHHGGQKLFAWFGGMPGGATAQAFTQPWIGGVIELIGGILLLIGLFTRPAAFIMAGEMAVAYFQVHQPMGLFPIQNHGEPAALYSFIFLFFAAHGGGEWSLDALRARGRVTAPRKEALVN
ncbi:MAG TPA: DoxX family protein [Thermoanaerobaculia bacterium]|jgi:putative oxidoreductase|nr:DoxX family protein [Thermoanaerobaculia bacterium]